MHRITFDDVVFVGLILTCVMTAIVLQYIGG